jgi:hypothetical protein
LAVVYNATLKTNRMQLVADLIASKVAAASTGAGSAGQLVIGTSALSGGTGVLATLALPNPPATVSGAVLTLSGVPLSVAASASGTAALAEFRNNAGTTITSGLTVGTVGTDVILGTTTITSGGTVTITSGTITHS